MSGKDPARYLKEKLEAWSEKVDKGLLKKPEREEAFVNTSGIPLKRLYTPLDIQKMDYLSDLGFPGEYPYTWWVGRPS